MRYVAVALAGLVVASGGLADEERNRAAAAPPGEAPPSAEKLAGFFGRTKGITRLVPPSDVWEGITSGRSRYFVVDVRPADDYAKGHVPGALSLPIDVLFRPESLAKLPSREKPIVLVCQSGHTESMALGGLAALGYEPWVMRFGMIGWNAETPVNAGPPGRDADTVHGVGGPIEK
jgi:rhodanese-related sulfurtransferase